MSIGHVLFSIQGRINRKTYWLAILPLAVSYAVTDMMTESADESIVVLAHIIMVILIWPSLAVQTKRWHDRDKSGWWNLISLIPIVGSIWAFIELGFLQGTSARNSYGLPPGARPVCGYGARINDVEDAYIAGPLGESGPVTSSGPFSNSWRNR